MPSNELIIAGGYSGQTKVEIGKIVNLFTCTFHVKHVFSCLLLFLFVVCYFCFNNVCNDVFKGFFSNKKHFSTTTSPALLSYVTIGVGTVTYPAAATDPGLRKALNRQW